MASRFAYCRTGRGARRGIRARLRGLPCQAGAYPRGVAGNGARVKWPGTAAPGPTQARAGLMPGPCRARAGPAPDHPRRGRAGRCQAAPGPHRPPAGPAPRARVRPAQGPPRAPRQCAPSPALNSTFVRNTPPHDTTCGGACARHHKMYAHARCRRRGIRCESGTVPQRCTRTLLRTRESEDLPTAVSYVRAPRVGPMDAVRYALGGFGMPARAHRVPPARPPAERGRALQ